MVRTIKQIGILAAVVILYCMPVAAEEEELEYKMDFGAALGTCFYLGDANSSPYAHMGAMGALTARRLLNSRMAVKANLAFGHISGESEGFLPTAGSSWGAEGGTPTQVSFSRNVLDVGAQFEMNFWGFGTGKGYKGNSRITPYALAGMGFTLGMGGGGESCFGLNLPVGVGVKYKLKPRVNIGLEWTMRFTTSDKLDAPDKSLTQLTHPFGIQGVGLKNKDCYSFTMLFVTYDICPKYRKCNN